MKLWPPEKYHTDTDSQKRKKERVSIKFPFGPLPDSHQVHQSHMIQTKEYIKVQYSFYNYEEETSLIL